MSRRTAIVAALLLGGCEPDGTVNNEDVVLATTVRISISEDGAEPLDHAYQSDISGDGRRIVFVTGTRNMHPDDTDTNLDVFVKNVVDGTIQLVDRSTGVAGVKAPLGASSPRISGDGRRVVFLTYARLDPDDLDDFGDVYVRDLETQETILASRATGAPGAKANRDSSEADISSDGRYVAFTSMATNLAAGDADSLHDIYLRDLETGATELISRPTGAGKSNGSCAWPRVSAGGARVAFLSSATNLEPSTGGVQHVYVRDRGAATTTLVSRASGAGGALASSYSLWPDISDDGRVVSFMSSAVNLHANDVDGFLDIYARDVDAAVTEHISRAGGAEGKDAVDECYWPSISGDGRFVTFVTLSSNLVKNDENLARDVFVRDRLQSSTFRASLRTFGGEGNGDAMEAAVSADGRYVIFGSRANNVVEGDGNGLQDVFLRGPLR